MQILPHHLRLSGVPLSWVSITCPFSLLVADTISHSLGSLLGTTTLNLMDMSSTLNYSSPSLQSEIVWGSLTVLLALDSNQLGLTMVPLLNIVFTSVHEWSIKHPSANTLSIICFNILIPQRNVVTTPHRTNQSLGHISNFRIYLNQTS